MVEIESLLHKFAYLKPLPCGESIPCWPLKQSTCPKALPYPLHFPS